MDRPPRKLLPGNEAPPEPSPTSSSVTSPTSSSNPAANAAGAAISTRRQVTSLACNECRRVKCKCDGERPTCGLCERKGVTCDYDAGPRGRTALMALRHQHSLLEAENIQLRELLRLIASLPPTDASEVLGRLRTNEDPLRVFQMVQAARLLMTDSGPSSTESQNIEGSSVMAIPSIVTATTSAQHSPYPVMATRPPTEPSTTRRISEESQKPPQPRPPATMGVRNELRRILNAPED
ncbi:transcriptional regulatory protein GAL4 [Microdochium nivale]|nr:transcriptional regulatory protein GAL4 [Microdochium nivale]